MAGRWRGVMPSQQSLQPSRRCVPAASAVILLCATRATEGCDRWRSAETVGRIQGDAESDICSWHIEPGMQLEEIEFWTARAYFSGPDYLSLYADSEATRSTLVVHFSAVNPIPRHMVLRGTHEALLVLTATSPDTIFDMEYECKAAGMQFGPLYLSPAGYFSSMAALLLIFLLLCLVPVYTVCYCRARYQHRRAVQRSQLLRHAELAQSALTEEQTVDALQRLPTRRWKAGPEDGGECGLCLERYKDEDEVRVLPCRHYFHSACVDAWFASRRFMPRTCPNCRRSPVEALPGGSVTDLEFTASSEQFAPWRGCNRETPAPVEAAAPRASAEDVVEDIVGAPGRRDVGIDTDGSSAESDAPYLQAGVAEILDAPPTTPRTGTGSQATPRTPSRSPLAVQVAAAVEAALARLPGTVEDEEEAAFWRAAAAAEAAEPAPTGHAAISAAPHCVALPAYG